ncbi:MAG: CCA tRNA nucleotidyltransferase [Thermodesulfobacteriota bacterium]
MNLDHLKIEILSDGVLSRLSNLAKEKNVSIFLVGGYIRDLFLGIHRKDYDFTLPKEGSSFIPVMEEALRFHFFKIGKEEIHPLTYRMVKNEISVDLTLFQGNTIEEDLGKRDFTVNAMAFSLRDETFHFVERALEDIERRVIRAVSIHSIDQDPLRMLRAFRYLCTLDGFLIDRGLEEEISLKKETIAKVPGERIKMELDQILLSPRPEMGIKFLYGSGLLFSLMPESKDLENLGQNEHHHLDALSHTLLMVDEIPWALNWVAQKGRGISLSQENRLCLYYAALFHDMGKQDTYSKDENGRVHFYHHEAFSCQRADGVMERLRFSNPTRDKILRLVRHHMRILNLSPETKETALKRLVNEMGEESSLLVLHTLADKEASRGILSIQIDEVVEGHCLRILDLTKEKEIVHPPPLITGHDVMSLGYASGPAVGKILSFIRGKQIEGEIKTREDALKVLREKFALN